VSLTLSVRDSIQKHDDHHEHGHGDGEKHDDHHEHGHHEHEQKKHKSDHRYAAGWLEECLTELTARRGLRARALARRRPCPCDDGKRIPNTTEAPVWINHVNYHHLSTEQTGTCSSPCQACTAARTPR
jgi:hypothetical protein